MRRKLLEEGKEEEGDARKELLLAFPKIGNTTVQEEENTLPLKWLMP